MDFTIVVRQISVACKTLGVEQYKLDVIRIFKYFYGKYFECFGYNHPKLKTETITDVIERITSMEEFEFICGEYELMIDKFFQTKFPFDCNYSIVLFSQHDILRNRYLETLF